MTVHSDLEKISNKMILRNYNKGQVILLEESKGETFFVIKTGEVKVTKLAQGLPVGGEIEQLDDGTLFSAFKNRVPVTDN